MELSTSSRLEQTLTIEEPSEVFCVRLNQKGEFLMSGHADRAIRLWNTNKGTFISEFSGAHNREIFDIAIFADNA
jgi:WD40 repeat protein